MGEGRRTVEIAAEKSTQHLYVYLDDEPVRGKVVVNLGKGIKEIEHMGIRVDFIGQIGTFPACIQTVLIYLNSLERIIFYLYLPSRHA